LSQSAALQKLFRLFSSALVDQAILSAASLFTGLLLIRQTSNAEYGYYVLFTAAILLLTSLQTGFLSPLIVRMAGQDIDARRDMVGGVFRDQRRWLLTPLPVLAVAVVALRTAGLVELRQFELALIFLPTAVAALNREYFRQVLLAYRRPGVVLSGDFIYVAGSMLGTLAAIDSPWPAAVACGGIGISSAVGTCYLWRALKRHEGWNIDGMPGILRRLAPPALWGCSGALIYWVFSQGYSYIAAITLNIDAVAALASARLLMMPVNLVSSGTRQILLPMASKWQHDFGIRTVLKRLAVAAVGLALVSAIYMLLMWLGRDWIFAEVLKKRFANRDSLLFWWSMIFLTIVVRDQLMYLLVVRERYKALAGLSFACAIMSLSIGYWGMLHYGEIGALLGMLIAEGVNLLGVLALIRVELNHPDSSLNPKAGGHSISVGTG
jgi:O-antigen/teichoic acid export membrane protein